MLDTGYIKASTETYYLLLSNGIEDNNNLLTSLKMRDFLTWENEKMWVVTDTMSDFEENTKLIPHHIKNNKIIIDEDRLNLFKLTKNDIACFKKYLFKNKNLDEWPKWQDKKHLFAKYYQPILDKIELIKKEEAKLFKSVDTMKPYCRLKRALINLF